jgi:SAM-dependent methyltransferase
MNTTSQEFFEDKYRSQGDPWGFAFDPYEQERYDCIYRSLSHRRYGVAFEPGCSIGVLTARLAPLCGRLQAIDISPSAVRQARERLQAMPNVHLGCGAIPQAIPQVNLDLVVFSEIGYYFDPGALHQLGLSLVSRLNPQGILLAAHWLGQSQDHRLDGDTVHQILGSIDGMVLDHSERHTGYRLDRWIRE